MKSQEANARPAVPAPVRANAFGMVTEGAADGERRRNLPFFIRHAAGPLGGLSAAIKRHSIGVWSGVPKGFDGSVIVARCRRMKLREGPASRGVRTACADFPATIVPFPGGMPHE